jgi:site-specific recombinase XerD
MTSQKLATIPSTDANLTRLAPLVERVRELIDEAKSSNTKSAYSSDWRRFEAWCVEHGLPALPPSAEAVTSHLAHLEREGLKSASIHRALAGIVFHFRKNGYDWTAPVVVVEMLKGLRRTLGTKQKKKQPAAAGVLLAMVSTFGVDLRGLRDRALLTVGWHGALRRSEIVALDVADAQFVPEGLVIELARSKTDQEGTGESKGLPFATNAELCPARSLRAWLMAAGLSEGAIFRGITSKGVIRKGRMTDRSVALIVKRAALAAGLNGDEFAGHSLRSGFMTEAGFQGVPLHEIMTQSGHKSERIARGYIRHGDLFKRNAAKGLV